MASALPRVPLPARLARLLPFLLAASVLSPASPSAADEPSAAELLETFRCVFAPERCTGDPGSKQRRPERCFQGPVADFARLRPGMDPASVHEIESYLRSRTGPRSEPSTYISPYGLFELSYETTGPDSVPSEDVDPANGIPDFVERCAEYADLSWASEAALGFTLPALPPDGTYDIAFQDLGNAVYGYTDIAGTTTTIILHHTFDVAIWPPNDDPDGKVLGRAKATIAHELRHASQYTNNGWSEGSAWEELDAAWVEDIVFPLTNDYVNFLDNGSLSQLDSPWTPMDSTSASVGGYEDCLWQHYLSGTYGTGIIRDLWTIRAAYPTQPMIESYAQVLMQYATTWDKAYPAYLEWCWFTGNRAIPGVGFPDADKLWPMEVVAATNSYPYWASDEADGLAGEPRRFRPGSATGYPLIHFDGDDEAVHLTVSVIAVEPDLSYAVWQPPLSGGNEFDFTIPILFQNLKHAAVIVTNVDLWDTPVAYTLSVEDHPPTAIGPGGGEPAVTGTRPELLPPDPNPSRGATRLRWTQPRAGAVTLRIVDVQGRVVRTLRDGTPSAARDAASWDGLADDGRPAPAGVYWVQLRTADGSVARRVVRVR